MRYRTIKGSDFLMLCLFIIGSANLYTDQKQSNILFIMIDDLRPELGCYALPQIKTPNLDQLATRSTLFNNDYWTSLEF
ncbi:MULTISPECIES: sulfatase-like hydrolase/transferase [Flavobacterium]|uniref:sulfatase-like hydrolase/transferase n=1 Tax=Flavobacterium TaxID=237 RepID=UPI002227927F|nr:sulfatase-like hydrolase/transferase [Flavobacterium sp. 7A]MCW2118805.1 membrane-anchored protein YejM (alkaline phosphatase superfamily) [Flavobacterium sp. 7A]